MRAHENNQIARDARCKTQAASNSKSLGCNHKMFGCDTTRTQLSVIDKQDVSLFLGQHLKICQQVQAVIVRACARKQPNCTRHKQPQTQKHKMQDARRKQHQTQNLWAAITKCLALTRHAHNLVSSKMRAHFGGQHFVAN